MADEMIFGVGFDVESGTDQAIKDWRVAQKVLQRELDKNTLDVKIKVSDKDSVNQIEKIRNRMKELSEEYDKLSINERFKFNADTGEIDGMTAKAEKLVSEFNKLTIYAETYGRSLQKVSADAVKELNLQTREIEKQAKELEKQQLAQQKLADKQRLADEKQIAKELAIQAREIEKQRAAQAKLMQSQRQKVAILQGEERTINQINAKLKIQSDRLRNIDLNSNSFTRVNKEVQRLTTLLSQAEAKVKSVNARGMTQLRSSVANVNKEYSRQLTYVERLLERAGVYGAIFAAGNFINNIRAVTAEFELQRVSLTAMMQSAADADKLFEQTVAAAVESPFQIKDLIQYTKQLAAFGVENDNLFDTTQMLADITAGLGTDFGRIALAYGQIRSRGFLAGTELKQLTELGLAFPEMLAERLSAVEGTAVTVADVFDRISNREITFGQVENIFKELTEDGGRFYEMQEKQAKTLAGLWSNLQDVQSLMFADIGEEVYDEMRSIIELYKSFIENWRTVKDVVLAAGVAYGVYALAMKNAAVTATVLTRAEVVNTLTTKKRTLALKGLGNAILAKMGIESASVKVSKLYTAATIKANAATNIFTRTFWRLTAAMFYNPFVAVAAVLTGVAAALLFMRKEAETTEDRIKSLNKSAVEIENIGKTGKLVDEYERLSNKANKTTEELRQLKSVTNQLAEQYPSAIIGVKNYGDEMVIAAEKVRELHEAEEKARKDRAKATEEQLREDRRLKQSEIEKLQAIIAAGSEEIKVPTAYGGSYTTEKTLTDTRRNEILDEIETLRQSNDEITTALDAYATKKAIDTLVTIEGWQKTFADARAKFERETTSLVSPEPTEIPSIDWASGGVSEYIKDLSEVGEQVEVTTKSMSEFSLYTKDQLAQFSSLNAALEDNAGKYKALKDNVDKYNKSLESTEISDKEREQITLAKQRAEAEMQVRYELLQRYNALSLVNDKENQTTADSIKSMQAQASLIQEIYKRYQEYLKYMSASDAQAKIRKLYKDSIATLGVDVAFDGGQLEASLSEIRKDLLALGTKEALEVAAKLGLTIDDVDYKELQDKLKKDLARISDEIKRSKEAQNFMQNILSATGNEQLATEMTVSIYGDIGDGLAKQMQEQIKTAFGYDDLSKPIQDSIDKAIGGARIDPIALQKLLPNVEGEENRKLAEGFIAQLVQQDSKAVLEYAKLLGKYADLRQQEIDIDNRVAAEKKAIDDGLAISIRGITDSDMIDDLKKQAEQAKETIDTLADWDKTKLSSEYVSFFSDFSTMTTDVALDVKNKLQTELIDAFHNGAMSAKQFQKEMKLIDKQFDNVAKQPNALKSYFEGGLDGLLDFKMNQANALFNIGTEVSKMKSPDQISDSDKEFIDKMVDGGLDGLLDKFGGDMGNIGGEISKIGKGMQGAIGGVMGSVSMIDMIVKAIDQSIQSISAMINELNAMRSEDNKIGGWFKYVEDVNKYAVGAWESLKSGDGVGTVTNVVSAIASVFNNAQRDKVERLNEEIERQGRIIVDLEYAYGRLQQAMENALGTDYVKNYNQQVETLLAQAQAAQAQASAEQSKGKSEDAEATQSYLDQYRDYMAEYNDLLDEYASTIIGSGLGDLTKEISSIWLEAKLAGESTMDALKAKSKEMVRSMVSDFVMAAAIERHLEPVFELIEKTMKNADLVEDPDYWAKVASQLNEAMENSDAELSALYDALVKAGVDLTDSTSGLSGISKDIASASEESILGLAAGINTQNYYIGGIKQDTAMIVAILRGGSAGLTPLPSVDVTTLITMQNGYLQNLPAIATHTANTVLECQNIVRSVDKVVTRLDRVIKSKGSPTNFVVKTEL